VNALLIRPDPEQLAVAPTTSERRLSMHLRQKLHTAHGIYAQGGIGSVYRVLRSRLSEASPLNTLYRNLLPRRFKESHELAYWEGVHAAHDTDNSWYVTLFTTYFGLTPEWYSGKRILDIGCGPLGSLEWADLALERVGLDPLARKYQQLGAARHKMTYVAAPSEHIVFEDGHFDVVSSFNSLDHVASVPRTIDEIVRVLKRRGLFLLITEVNHHPTPTEPQTFGWDIVDRFQPALELIEAREYERSPVGVYTSIEARQWFDRGNPAERPGVVSSKFQKR